MARAVVLALIVLVAPLLLSGCAAQEDRERGRLMEHEDAPKSMQRARFYEEKALEQVRAGNSTKKPGKRKELYDDALDLFRQARQLYEDELLRDQNATPERKRNLRAEIDRLSDVIDQIHKDRPLE